MTTELRPCSLCGVKNVLLIPYASIPNSDREDEIGCQYCKIQTVKSVWNNAWAWKEIDRLNVEIKSLREVVKLQSEERWSWSEKKSQEVRELETKELKLELEKVKKERDEAVRCLRNVLSTLPEPLAWKNEDMWKIAEARRLVEGK